MFGNFGVIAQQVSQFLHSCCILILTLTQNPVGREAVTLNFSNCFLPQAPARLRQAASYAIQTRRSWQTRMCLTSLYSLEQTERGSERRGRERWRGRKGRGGTYSRGRPPVSLLLAGALDSPLAVMRRGWVPVLGAAPRVWGSHGEAVPA